jgi:hypothetical protein
MTKYVMFKRDLFECPGHMGYTGIRDKAGTWDGDYVKQFEFRVLDKYAPNERDHYALPVHLAPEFTKTSFHDLNEAHLRSRIDSLTEENARLREELAVLHDKDLSRTVIAMREAA